MLLPKVPRTIKIGRVLRIKLNTGNDRDWLYQGLLATANYFNIKRNRPLSYKNNLL